MKLYYINGACSLAPRILINELGLDCDYVFVNQYKKITENGDDYLKINPKSVVPALLTNDGQVLTETATIMQYLADIHHATSLFPSLGDYQRYKVLEWMNYISTEVHKRAGYVLVFDIPQDIKETWLIPLLTSKIEFIDDHLNSNTYLLGNIFTIADIYLFVILSWVLFFEIDIKKWTNVHRYFNELQHRSSIINSLKQEQLDFSDGYRVNQDKYTLKTKSCGVNAKY